MVEFSTGSLFAGHRIEAVAGRGGMGVVYRATQLDLGRTLALKVIAPELAEDARLRDRFVNESRVAASIDHPNVIPIFYAGEDQGVLYIAMRFVVGTDLRRLVRAEGRLALGRAMHVIEQVADALDAAHVRGLVHRDVKPANVLLAAHDHAYLTDFGLTRRIVSAGEATRSGAFVGTLDYAAPEQIRGERVDARGDVYALGCLLFYLLTGEVPYPRDTDEAKLWAHLSEPAPSAAALVKDLPPRLDDVIARAMSKQPDDRFPSAGDVARAAIAAARDQPVGQAERRVAEGPAAPWDGSTVSGRQPASPPQRRARGRRVVALLTVAVAVAVGVGIAVSRDPDPSPPAPPRPPAGTLVATIPVGQRPNAIAATARDVWITSYRNDAVTRVSTSTDRVRDARLVIGIGGMDVATGYDAVWFVNSRRRELTRVSARSGRRRGRPLVLPSSPVTVDAGGGAVWVGAVTLPVSTGRSTIYRVDRRRMRVTDTITVPGTIRSLATGRGSVWYVADRALYRLGMGVRTARRIVAVGRESTVTVGAGAAWVASRRAGKVLQVEIPSGRIVTIPMRGAPSHVAVADGAVWVSNYGGHTLTRIDPRTSAVVRRPVKVGRNPLALTAGAHAVWATLVADNSIARVDFR